VKALQDHKRAFDGDEGHQHRRMGAYSPAPVLTTGHSNAQVMARIGSRTRGRDARTAATLYRGVLYLGGN